MKILTVDIGTGTQDIFLYAPWPENKPRPESTPAFGAAIEVDEGGGFSPFPLENTAWTYQGGPAASKEAIRILPRLSASISLSLAKLKAAAPKAVSYRLTALGEGAPATVLELGPAQSLSQVR